ncbi:MAG: CRISPR-associated endonuclease Cas2 [Armatimonadetes bacterium RBG_16_58_9]|nr:MAG: CRISPR-associated endonuclease Cas2 [Armatimonadetes bacterium RBG_16_58_9]
MSRFMRLFVLFDLPVVKTAERRAYARFHKFLLRDGYDMIQYSVYARICNCPEAVDKHVTRLQAHAPPAGSVRYMRVTEKQFTDMKVLVGEKRKKEDPKFANQLALF